MNPPIILIATVSGWLALLGLWVLFFSAYREYRVAAFRQALFGLRDELFDCAARGEISFEHDSYRLLRQHLNGMIRFAERLSLWWVLSMLIVRSIRPTPEFEARLHREHEHIFSNAPADTRDHLRRIHDRAILFAVEQMVLTSLLFWLLVIPVLGLAVISAISVRAAIAATRFVPGRSIIDHEALAMGL